jgi:hypothetical protein
VSVSRSRSVVRMGGRYRCLALTLHPPPPLKRRRPFVILIDALREQSKHLRPAAVIIIVITNGCDVHSDD